MLLLLHFIWWLLFPIKKPEEQRERETGKAHGRHRGEAVTLELEVSLGPVGFAGLMLSYRVIIAIRHS